MGRYKLPVKALHLLIPFFLSFAMSGIVSCISTLRAVGVADFEVCAYLLSWMYSWAIAFPSVLILLPLARKLALCLVQPTET